ncbi:MAG: glycyl-radical enzyme activating protein [Bacteroidota bacterium]
MSTVVIFDIKRFAVHDGPGIRTTVFLKGCPLRCWWCHNPESQAMEPITVDFERKVNGKTVPGKKTYGEKIEVDALMEVLLRDHHFYEESGGGVTFSGGEPMMQIDGLTQLLESCRRSGIHTTVDTSGFAKREHFDKILSLTDLFLYDLKNMDSELHKKYTGANNGLIRSNADFLLENSANVVFRIPVIPGVNTTGKEVNRMIGFLKERHELMKEVHLLPYHRIAENKYFRLRMQQQFPDVREPDQAFIEQLKMRFEESGLEVVIGG